jgi:hypothetical protein
VSAAFREKKPPRARDRKSARTQHRRPKNSRTKKRKTATAATGNAGAAKTPAPPAGKKRKRAAAATATNPATAAAVTKNNTKPTPTKPAPTKPAPTKPALAKPNVFEDDISNAELKAVIDAHYQALLDKNTEVQTIADEIQDLRSAIANMRGFHTIHRRRDAEARVRELNRELERAELGTAAHEFRTAAMKLYDRIAPLQPTGGDIAVVEGLVKKADTSIGSGSNSSSSTGANDSVDGDAGETPASTLAPAVPRRRRVALSATRTISFGMAESGAASGAAPGAGGTASATSGTGLSDAQPFRELFMDELRLLMNPDYVRPAYRVSAEECVRCKGSLSFVSTLNVLVCDNPACQQEQQVGGAHVGFGNKEHMSLSSCRYKKRGHFAKNLKKTAQKVVLKGVMTPAQFFDIKQFVAELRAATNDGSENAPGPATQEQVCTAITRLGYQKQLGKLVARITDLVNFKPAKDYTPAQTTFMLELFMLGEPVYDAMQRNNEVNGRINTLNHQLRGRLINSMLTFGDQHKDRFKELKGKAGAAEQQKFFKTMMEREGIPFTPIEV